MIEPIDCDTRGKLGQHFSTYFDAHSRIAERFKFEIKGQAADWKSRNAMGEVKLTPADLHDIPRLKREIAEVYSQDHSDFRYLDLVFNEDEVMIKAKDYIDKGDKKGYYLEMKKLWDFWHDLRIVLSLIDDYYPLIRLKIYKRPELLIEGILDRIEQPPSYSNANIAPVDYRDQDKGMILSLCQKMDGITPQLAKFIWEYPSKLDPWFKCEQDFTLLYHCDPNAQCLVEIPRTEAQLTAMFEEIFYQYFKRQNPDGTWKYTEHKKLAADFAHCWYKPYGSE